MNCHKIRFITSAVIGKRFSTTSSSSFVTNKVSAAKGKRPRAIVLVLGFGGAKPKHVAKYAQLYNSKGCSTVSGTASNHDIFIDQKGIDGFAENAVQHVVKLIREDDATSCPELTSEKGTPIIMHMASNGGAFVGRSIGHMLNHQHKTSDLQLFSNRLKLGCQVFDSAPCYLDAKSSFNVMKHLLPNPIIGIPAAILFAFRSFALNAISMITGRPTHRESFWKALLEDTNCNRQAFVYTHQDDVANAEKIEEFIAERKKRGVNVMAKHFEHSSHVQHLRLHEREYSEYIDAVLTDMEDRNSNELITI